MIKTFEQAKKIQQRRVDAGKPGFARAVRRFLKEDLNIGCIQKHKPGSFHDHQCYMARKALLPHIGYMPADMPPIEQIKKLARLRYLS